MDRQHAGHGLQQQQLRNYLHRFYLVDLGRASNTKDVKKKKDPFDEKHAHQTHLPPDLKLKSRRLPGVELFNLQSDSLVVVGGDRSAG